MYDCKSCKINHTLFIIYIKTVNQNYLMLFELSLLLNMSMRPAASTAVTKRYIIPSCLGYLAIINDDVCYLNDIMRLLRDMVLPYIIKEVSWFTEQYVLFCFLQKRTMQGKRAIRFFFNLFPVLKVLILNKQKCYGTRTTVFVHMII